MKKSAFCVCFISISLVSYSQTKNLENAAPSTWFNFMKYEYRTATFIENNNATLPLGDPNNNQTSMQKLLGLLATHTTGMAEDGWRLLKIEHSQYNQALTSNINQTKPMDMLWAIYERPVRPEPNAMSQLLNDINNHIDSLTKYRVDSAIAIVHRNTLNYLKDIPKSVISDEYKKEMTDAIIIAVKQNYDVIILQLKDRIRLLEQH